MISTKKKSQTRQTHHCNVPGCRGRAIDQTLCRICGELITRKEHKRFMAAVGASNKLRYYRDILVPTIKRRYQHRGEN